jgi:hypothetical protein
MNIRFADAALRCRVSQDELQRLLAGRSLVLEVALPRNHAFRISVKPSLLGGWQLDSDPTGIWVSIPRLDLEALSQSLPSREGIEQKFPTKDGKETTVVFEVDVKGMNRGA